MTLILPHDLEEQLRSIAEREQHTPEAVLRTLLADYTIQAGSTIADLATALADANFRSGHSDAAAQSRQFLL